MNLTTSKHFECFQKNKNFPHAMVTDIKMKEKKIARENFQQIKAL